MTLPSQPDLHEAFQIPDFSLWREAAEAALKGASFEKTLYTRTLEGLLLKPLYMDQDADPPSAQTSSDGRRGLGHPQQTLEPGWTMAQEIPLQQPAAFAQALAEELHQGLQGLRLNLDQLAPASAKDLQTALAPLVQGESLEQHVHLPMHLHTRHALAGLVALDSWRSLAQVPWQDLQGSFCCDGLAALLRPGAPTPDPARHFDALAHVVEQLQQSRLAAVGIDATVYAEAGAHAAQELAFGCAALTETVQQLAERGLAPSLSLSVAHLQLSAGVNLFMEIAKFRAARVLLQRIAAAYGTSAGNIGLHARTSQIGLTCYDPYSNFLRQTVSSLAAVLGGARVLTTGCFNESLGSGDAFARRLARNLQLILKHEVKLDRLIDPVGGSYFLESLTTSLATAAWEQFQQIEAGGGLLQALLAGGPQAAIAATAQERLHRVHTRRQLLVGTTAYANPTETLHVEHLEPLAAPVPEPAVTNLQTKCSADPTAAQLEGTQAFATGLSWTGLVQALHGPAGPSLAPLPPLRLAAEFEALRQHNETQPLRCMLLPLFSLAEARPRLDFSRALLEVAGLQPELATPITQPEGVVSALADSAPAIVLLCGSDARYGEWAAEIAQALKQAYPQLKLGLAGKPADHESSWKAAGIDFFVFLGCDALAVFQQWLAA